MKSSIKDFFRIFSYFQIPPPPPLTLPWINATLNMWQVKHIKKLKHAEILNRKFAVFLANSIETAFTKKKKTATKQTTPNAQKHCILFFYMNETQFYTGNFILLILSSFHHVKYTEIRNFLCFFLFLYYFLFSSTEYGNYL